MNAENLAVVLKCQGDLRLEERPIPTPGHHEVLIAIHSTGICGSDVHFWKKGRIGDFIVEEPIILGHESSGTVVKVGEHVKHLKPGDRVCIEPGFVCRHCDFCKSGRYNLCSNCKAVADGTLCRYFTHAADFCYKLPDHVSYEEGALMEPLSVAVHACRRGGVKIGSAILICGAGPIGLVNMLTAKAMGVSKICVTDTLESRLLVAKTLGANCVLNVAAKDTAATAKEIQACLGQSPDITIECSGAESSIRLAILATRSGGTIVLVGLGAEEVSMPVVNATVREVDIRGVFKYTNCYPTALDLVASGAVDVKPLITHQYKIEDSLQAFETAHSGSGNAIKVIIQCNKN